MAIFFIQDEPSSKIRLMSTKDSNYLIAKFLIFINFGLFFIWVLPETIGLRHVFLGLGFLLSAILIVRNYSKILSKNKSNLPLLLIALNFIWIGIHFSFFSLNRTLEINEITGLWLRALLGCIFALGVGYAISKYDKLKKYVYIAFFSTPIINLIAYLYASWINKHFLYPNEFLRFLFTKIEITFFGSLALAVTIARLLSFIDGTSRGTLKNFSFLLLGVIIIFASNIVSDSRSGNLIFSLYMLVLIIWILMIGIKNKNVSQRIVARKLLFVFVATFAIWVVCTQSVSQRKWDLNFIQDLHIAIDIRGNTQWKEGEGAVPLPTNASGNLVNSSTYHRIAWATAGLDLILRYPLGYGSIKHSFVGLLDLAGLSHGGLGQTHNGVVDFGLAYGIPGVLIFLTIVVSIVYFGARNADELSRVAMILAMTCALLMCISEVAWKQYLEALFFILTFSASLVFFRKIRT